jgi:hypothetical protein
MQTSVEVRNHTKRFGTSNAIDEISFDIFLGIFTRVFTVGTTYLHKRNLPQRM